MLRVAADNVGLEPDGLAFEVACVVEMKIDLLLRVVLVEVEHMIETVEQTL